MGIIDAIKSKIDALKNKSILEKVPLNKAMSVDEVHAVLDEVFSLPEGGAERQLPGLPYAEGGIEFIKMPSPTTDAFCLIPHGQNPERSDWIWTVNLNGRVTMSSYRGAHGGSTFFRTHISKESAEADLSEPELAEFAGEIRERVKTQFKPSGWEGWKGY